MVSIIVPIYNVKKFLDDCIGSILGSDYRDLEVILVDDGSTDGSGDVCDLWAARDQRVEVIHQANAGIAGARNAGMAAARGEYLLFVDGDDVIDRQMVGTLVAAIEGGDYDLAMVLGRSVTEDEAAVLAQGKNEPAAPATRTRPVILSASDSTLSGIPSFSGSGMPNLMTLMTADTDPRCLKTLTLNLPSSGIENEKSSSSPASRFVFCLLAA